MKMPILWHEECLKNATEHYEREAKSLEIQRENLERSRVALAIYEYQIKRAKEEGKDGFDREKYGKPRRDAASSGGSDGA